MSRISIIVPAYHANERLYELTRACLDSVWETDAQIIIVADKASYTVNTNAGLRAASGDILVVANNDMVFEGAWLDGLLSVIQAGYDIATCWTSDQLAGGASLPMDGITAGAKFGSLFAMTREVYQTVGAFDEQFGGYFSDTDYRRRALDAGFSIGRNNSLTVRHLAKATYKETDPSDAEFQRSRILFEMKHGYGADTDED